MLIRKRVSTLEWESRLKAKMFYESNIYSHVKKYAFRDTPCIMAYIYNSGDTGTVARRKLTLGKR
jgi:hypothetical protein